jgi:putative redox protein
VTRPHVGTTRTSSKLQKIKAIDYSQMTPSLIFIVIWTKKPHLTSSVLPLRRYVCFMKTMMTGKYEGDLRCSFAHVASGQKLITDAPVDNQGQGQAFSPTDLMCTSLAACMLTIMGIAAKSKSIPFEEVTIEIEKVMGTEPRRVVAIYLHIRMNGKDLDEKSKYILEQAAHTCPVAKSLHPDITQDVRFDYF